MHSRFSDWEESTKDMKKAPVVGNQSVYKESDILRMGVYAGDATSNLLFG